MHKIHLFKFFIALLLFVMFAREGSTQTWEVFDSNFHLEKKLSKGEIFLLGNSLRINVWNNDLSFLDSKYEPFTVIEDASLYQFLEPWIIIKNNDKFGALHEYGEQVLPAIYDEIDTYYTLLLARKGEEYFVYDRGKRSTFSIGNFASARIARNGQVIAQNSDGSFILPLSETPEHKYVSLTDPTDDVIVAREATGLGLINMEGKYILKPVIDELTHLEDSYFYAKNSNEYLLINALSTTADIRYNSFHRISIENDVMVEYIHGKLRRIMKNDGILLDIVGMDSVRKSGDYFNVHFRDGTTGLLNKEGDWEVRPTKTATGILPGNEGAYGAKIGDGFGFINANGDTLVSPKFDQVKIFSEGMASVKTGTKWGYINQQNELVIPYTYNTVGPFLQGIAIVQNDGTYNLIDKSGESMLETPYTRVSRMMDGYYLLEDKGLFGLAKPDGTVISNPVYEEIRREAKDKILIRKDGKYGVIKENGDFELPLFYNAILFDNKNDKILAKSETEAVPEVLSKKELKKE
ncbi:WG repeat-containing protein [Cyclobacterium qasimii]|nr:WG repeat-containing protein [Cyclobacterium qasimii]